MDRCERADPLLRGTARQVCPDDWMMRAGRSVNNIVHNSYPLESIVRRANPIAKSCASNSVHCTRATAPFLCAMFPLLPLAGWWLTKWLVVPVAALVVLTILRNYIRDPFTWLKLRPGDNPLPKAYGWPVLGIVPEVRTHATVSWQPGGSRVRLTCPTRRPVACQCRFRRPVPRVVSLHRQTGQDGSHAVEWIATRAHGVPAACCA